MGHALVARARGMPIRGITLFLFGGVAEIGDEPPSAVTEFLMAIAGPLVSMALAAGLWLLTLIGYRIGWPHSVVIVLGYLAAINALVLVFNLIPAFPLDGGRVLRSILWSATGSLRRATRWASLAGQAFAWLRMAWGFLQFFGGNWIGGVWTCLISMFLSVAAQISYQQVLVKQALRGATVRTFMNPDPVVVPESFDLLHWVEGFVYKYHRKAFPVVSDGHLVGYIQTRSISGITRDEWVRHTIGELMRTDLEALTVAPDADAMDAMSRMQRSDVTSLMVTDGDRLIGVISLSDLLRFLDLKLDLDGGDVSRPGSETGATRCPNVLSGSES
jgi:Zn-dependent protease/CBS domain-containing protein